MSGVISSRRDARDQRSGRGAPTALRSHSARRKVLSDPTGSHNARICTRAFHGTRHRNHPRSTDPSSLTSSRSVPAGVVIVSSAIAQRPLGQPQRPRVRRAARVLSVRRWSTHVRVPWPRLPATFFICSPAGGQGRIPTALVPLQAWFISSLQVARMAAVAPRVAALRSLLWPRGPRNGPHFFGRPGLLSPARA